MESSICSPEIRGLTELTYSFIKLLWIWWLKKEILNFDSIGQNRISVVTFLPRIFKYVFLTLILLIRFGRPEYLHVLLEVFLSIYQFFLVGWEKQIFEGEKPTLWNSGSGDTLPKHMSTFLTKVSLWFRKKMCNTKWLLRFEGKIVHS